MDDLYGYCVYKSNQAKREQMKGRINRLGTEKMTRQHRYYYKFHAGMTTIALKHHIYADITSKTLKKLAKHYSARK